MTLILQDPSLIAHQAHINGHWVDADSGETLELLIRQPEKFCLRSLNVGLLKPEE